VADANVLYWRFYSNFPSVQYAGGRQPAHYQISLYPAYWNRATAQGTSFHVTPATLAEFAKAAEYAELETIWLTDPNPPQPDPANPVSQFTPVVCKLARYHYGRQLPSIRQAVERMITYALQKVKLLGQFPTADDQHARSLQEWRPSCGDFTDAIIVATAKEFGMPHILSDDMDLATFAGITLYTANARTIQSATAAGKLL
jgi:hypothetical protein